MKTAIFLACIALVGCAMGREVSETDTPSMVVAAKASGIYHPDVCECSNGGTPSEPNCDDGDIDGDCICTGVDNCPGTPNCDQANEDADAFGSVCDIMPNTPDPEATIAALDTRLDALETAQAAVTALQGDVALLTAALAEIRTKYPEHFHGLLGINGEPVGSDGDLSYSLPGD